MLSDSEFRDVLAQSSAFNQPEPNLFPGLKQLVDRQSLGPRLRGTGPTGTPAASNCMSLPQLESAHSHNFDLLGSGPVKVGYGCQAIGSFGHRYSMPAGGKQEQDQIHRMLRNLEDLARFTQDSSATLEQLVQILELGKPGYEPVDWHLDFKSGYRWDPDTWYMDIPYGHLPGVDVKVPWELSRCHHLVSMALQELINGSAGNVYSEISLQLADWITANPVRFGVNWRSAMDVAIRSVNWVWALALIPETALPPALRWMVAKSLYQHAAHIESHLDYAPHLTNNHYLADIVGLMYVAFVCPQFPQSPRWMAFCLQELVSEMRRTVYPDGTSYEASTGYHRLVTEMFLHGSLLALRLSAENRQSIAECSVKEHRALPSLAPDRRWEFSLEAPAVLPTWYWDRLERMVRYVSDTTKPNGLTPQWGDQDSARLVRFPLLTPGGLREWTDPKDHLHILSVGQALFGYDYSREAYSDAYPLDGQILTLDIDGLPISGTRISESQEVGTDVEKMNAMGKGFQLVQDHQLPETPLREESSSSSVIWYPDGGTCILASGPFWVGIRCEPAGQGGKGGHEHNDRLSFELNVSGHDVVVDWGTGVYSADIELRNQFRSTANHSTVAVAGREQNPWQPGLKGLFDLPENSRARCIEAGPGRFTGQHTGFGPVHIRRYLLNSDCLTIEDELDVAGSSASVLTLAPEVTAEHHRSSNLVLLRVGQVTLSVEPEPRDRTIHLEPGLYSEEYGEVRNSLKIVLERNQMRDGMRLRLLAQ
jgi:hypothetical protein